MYPIAVSMSAMFVGYMPCSIRESGTHGETGGAGVLGRVQGTSVRRKRGVDLPLPGRDSTVDMHGVLEAGRLDRGERLGTADTGLAVEHDLAVLRQPGEGL